MPLYPNEVIKKPYPCRYKVLKFQKFDRRKEIKEHVLRILYSMGPFSHDATVCLKEFSKSLTDRAYTWYVNLKLGSVRDFEHLVSLFNSKFFCAEVLPH